MTQEPKAVYKGIATVTRALSKEGIAKTSKNVQQGYNFRGIDAIYNALSSELAAAELCIIPRIVDREVIERQTRNGGALFYVTIKAEYDIVSAVDGSCHTASAYGEAMDSGDKATNKAMSASYKYMAMQLFCIPTEGDNDADSTTHEVAPRAASYQPPPAKPSAPAPKPANPVPIKTQTETLSAELRALRDAERKFVAEPPTFKPDKKWELEELRAVLTDQCINSRIRIYTWLVDKNKDDQSTPLPDLSELDNAGLMDLAYAAAGL